MRHPGDALRIGAGLSTLAVTGVLAHAGRPSRVEVDVFRVVNDLPDAVERLLATAMQAGSLAAVPVTAAAALLARRPRLGRDVAFAGVLAWWAAKAVKDLVDRDRPGRLLAGVVVEHTRMDSAFHRVMPPSPPHSPPPPPRTCRSQPAERPGCWWPSSASRGCTSARICRST